jgi:hypothetical protein
MKNLKRMVMVAVAVSVVGSVGTVFAYAAKSPVDIVSELTGKSVEVLISEHNEGKTYGTIANEAGVLEAYKAESLKEKKAILDERVDEGVLDAEKATDVYNELLKANEDCDGDGSAQIGSEYGVGFGNNSISGSGQNARSSGGGQGSGQGRMR